MKLFGKKEEKKACCCGGNCTSETVQKAEKTKADSGIKILGSGCAKCNMLEQSVRKAIQELGLAYEIEHIRDFVEIASYGVMSTPALVVDGKVVSYGKVLSLEECKQILNSFQKNEQ